MVRLVNTRESGFITGSLVLDEGVVIEEFDAVIIAFQGPDEVDAHTAVRSYKTALADIRVGEGRSNGAGARYPVLPFIGSLPGT